MMLINAHKNIRPLEVSVQDIFLDRWTAAASPGFLSSSPIALWLWDSSFKKVWFCLACPSFPKKCPVLRLEVLKQEALDELAQIEEDFTKIEVSQDLEAFEHRILSINRRIADLTTAIAIQKLLDNSEFRKEGKALLRSCSSKRICKGLRSVNIRFAGGTEISLVASYWGRKRFQGKREKGVFPELILLGVYHKCTPSLSAQKDLLKKPKICLPIKGAS